MKKLSEVIDIIGGGTPKTNNSEYWNGDIMWLSVKDFNSNNRYTYKTEKTITEKGLKNSSANILDEGDIVISARGTVGEITLLPYPMSFNQSCYGIKAKSGIDKMYLYYLLKYSVSILKLRSYGSVFDTITTNTFDEIVVSVHNLEEQKKIAKILSKIDEKIELNNKINDNLSAYSMVA